MKYWWLLCRKEDADMTKMMIFMIYSYVMWVWDIEAVALRLWKHLENPHIPPKPRLSCCPELLSKSDNNLGHPPRVMTSICGCVYDVVGLYLAGHTILMSHIKIWQKIGQPISSHITPLLVCVLIMRWGCIWKIIKYSSKKIQIQTIIMITHSLLETPCSRQEPLVSWPGVSGAMMWYLGGSELMIFGGLCLRLRKVIHSFCHIPHEGFLAVAVQSPKSPHVRYVWSC